MSTLLNLASVQAVGGQIRVDRATSGLPATTSTDIFSIDGGRVVVLEIIGEVTTVIQTQTCATKLIYDPDTGGSDVDICATLDITAQAVGTLNSITGDFSDAMIAGVSALEAPSLMSNGGIILPEGDIKVNTGATNTGAIQWTILYRPLDDGAIVTAV